MATNSKSTETPATITIEMPSDPAAQRFLMVMAGDSAAAKQALAEIAKEQRTHADKASELRQLHDSLLASRKAMRGDLADVTPLRAPRGSGSTDETPAETTPAANKS